MALPANAIYSLHLLVVGRYADIAAGCLFIFDYFLTLDLEIKFIWKSKLNMVKIMYFMNRFTTILDFVLVCLRTTTTDTARCPGLMQAEMIVYILGVYLAEYTFAMRTYIIWQKKWIVWVPLCLYYIGTFVHTFTANYSILTHVQYFPPLLPLKGCIPETQISIGWKYMIFLVAYDAAMIVLIGLAATIGAWRNGVLVQSDLFRVLYGEGILFYIYVLALSITPLLTIRFLGAPIFVFMARCVRSILASRVILHIRETGYHRGNHPMLLGNTVPS